MGLLANCILGAGERAIYGGGASVAMNQRGQALVETLILTPLAIFLLIGVLEIGWALRNYLVLENATREAARFAVRPNYVDYDAEYPDYSPIVTHTFEALSRQIEFTPTGIIKISRIYIETGYPCDPAIIWDADSPDYLNCDCQAATQNPYTVTVAITPLEMTRTFSYTWPETATVATKLDYAMLRTELITTNIIHNCNLMNRGFDRPQVDDVIYVEMFWQHYQLFGFPGWNNPILNPITLTTHAVFRRLRGRQ